MTSQTHQYDVQDLARKADLKELPGLIRNKKSATIALFDRLDGTRSGTAPEVQADFNHEGEDVFSLSMRGPALGMAAIFTLVPGKKNSATLTGLRGMKSVTNGSWTHWHTITRSLPSDKPSYSERHPWKELMRTTIGINRAMEEGYQETRAEDRQAIAQGVRTSSAYYERILQWTQARADVVKHKDAGDLAPSLEYLAAQFCLAATKADRLAAYDLMVEADRINDDRWIAKLTKENREKPLSAQEKAGLDKEFFDIAVLPTDILDFTVPERVDGLCKAIKHAGRLCVLNPLGSMLKGEPTIPSYVLDSTVVFKRARTAAAAIA